MAITSPDHPPTYDPFMVLTLVDGCVTFDFKVFNQSVQNGIFSWDKVETLLNTLLPYSGYVLCPGLKEYPAAVHFHAHMNVIKAIVVLCGMCQKIGNNLLVQCYIMFVGHVRFSTISLRLLESDMRNSQLIRGSPGNSLHLRGHLSIVLHSLVHNNLIRGRG